MRACRRAITNFPTLRGHDDLNTTIRHSNLGAPRSGTTSFGLKKWPKIGVHIFPEFDLDAVMLQFSSHFLISKIGAFLVRNVSFRKTPFPCYIRDEVTFLCKFRGAKKLVYCANENEGPTYFPGIRFRPGGIVCTYTENALYSG